MAEEKELAKTKALAAKLLHAAFTILKDSGRELPRKELIARIEKEVELTSWDREAYENTGRIRWETILGFFSIGAGRAGFIIKKKGIWYLTPEGEEAIKLGPAGILKAVNEAYKKWKEQQTSEIAEAEAADVEAPAPIVEFDKVEQIALEGLQAFINSKNAYEFQDLVAALLRGMGYYTPFVAPKGKDGGIDVVAYRDPLGTKSPRIQIQIKHRPTTSSSAPEVRQLMGLLQKEGDVGMFVSTGGFTPDAKTTARSSHIHVELIDLPRFINLWQEFYEKLSDEDKGLLPLTPIYFLAVKD